MQTTVGRHVQNIQNRSSTRAPQFSTSQSDWDETDLPNSPCADASCCLPTKISRVPHLRIQPCSLEINLAAVLTCLNLDSNHRLVYCCLSLTDFSHLGFRLSRALAFALKFGRLLVPTISSFVSVIFRSFDTHPRIASAPLSVLRNLCLSGFLFLSCHPSCPCGIFLCLCEEKYVTVMSTVSGCDVTTVQQHYTGSTSKEDTNQQINNKHKFYCLHSQFIFRVQFDLSWSAILFSSNEYFLQ